MIDSKQRAKLDQQISLLSEFLPSVWMGIYRNLIKIGFKESVALDLTKTYILASSANICPPSSDNHNTKDDINEDIDPT